MAGYNHLKAWRDFHQYKITCISNKGFYVMFLLYFWVLCLRESLKLKKMPFFIMKGSDMFQYEILKSNDDILSKNPAKIA
jgi:hypothetical protein